MNNILLVSALLGLTACGQSHLFVVEKNTLIETTRGYIEACGTYGTIFNSGQDTDNNGQLEANEITSSDYICDGVNGSDGLDSLIVNVINPCGDGQGHDEIILELSDGTFMAWYKNLGLSLLEENKTYRTTDAQQCRFKITNGQVLEI